MGRRTASIKTLGCKLNQYESEQMRVQLEGLGYRIVDYEAGADLCIVNSCTVTSRTDRETRRLARGAKRLNPQCHVVVAGCYVDVSPEDLRAIPEIDLLMRNADKQRLAAVIPPADDACSTSSAALGEPIISEFSGHTRAFVKVQEGCDARCAYCIIPDARGPSRSVELEQVLAQCSALAESGYPEIILIGTHLGRYGRDLRGDIDLDGLIALVCDLPIPRVRLSSIEPREVTPGIVRMVQDGGQALAGGPHLAASGKLCRHLHIPLQSGCDSVLRRMNRPYDTASYSDLVRRIKQNQPDACIGADVIVGFPGETDEEFATTQEFIESLPLSYLHVFTYSDRLGTPAARMPDQVDYELRKARNHVLRDISDRKRQHFAESMVGKRLEVVLQTRQADGVVRGISDNYLEVDVEGTEGRTGELVSVRIEAARGSSLLGRPAQ